MQPIVDDCVQRSAMQWLINMKNVQWSKSYKQTTIDHQRTRTLWGGKGCSLYGRGPGIKSVMLTLFKFPNGAT